MTAPGMRTGRYFAGCRRAADTRSIPTVPARPSGREIHDANALYVARVVSWHRIVPGPDGRPSERCTCRAYAVLCPYIRVAHDILGHPVPWDTGGAP